MGLFGNALNWIANPTAMVAGLTSFGGDMILQDQQNQANKDMLRSQRDFSLDMWQRQNEYNLPINQVKRLEAAGLNPQLAYGQVGESRAGAINIPSAPEMGRAKAPNLADYQQVVNLQEQNKLVRAQAERVAQDTRKAAADADYAEYETKSLKDSGMIKSDTGIPGLFKWGIRGIAGSPSDRTTIRTDFQNK